MRTEALGNRPNGGPLGLEELGTTSHAPLACTREIISTDANRVTSANALVKALRASYAALRPLRGDQGSARAAASYAVDDDRHKGDLSMTGIEQRKEEIDLFVNALVELSTYRKSADYGNPQSPDAAKYVALRLQAAKLLAKILEPF